MKEGWVGEEVLYTEEFNDKEGWEANNVSWNLPFVLERMEGKSSWLMSLVVGLGISDY